MTGLRTPRSTQPSGIARIAARAFDWAAVLGGAAALVLATSAGRAETPSTAATLATASVAATFADLGPASPEVFAQSGAVDVTEIAAQATTPATRLIGSGMASYYGRELAGHRTASGEAFDPADLTAAHRSLPFGTRVRVTSQATGQSVIVRINDRGPFSRGRVIDLSQGAAERIGLTARGHGTVSMELVEG